MAAGIAWFLRTIGIPTWRSIRAGLRRVSNFLLDWEGEPGRDGKDPRPSFPTRMTEIEKLVPGLVSALDESRAMVSSQAELLEQVHYHVKSNGGESAWDTMAKKVDGVANAQLAVADSMDRLADKTTTELQQLRESTDARLIEIQADKRAAHDEIRNRLARIETPHGEES